MTAQPPSQAQSDGSWRTVPYALFPRGDWTHVLLSSPLARYRILDPKHVRIYGKGRNNFSGLLCRFRMAPEQSACSVVLYEGETGGALVLFGGRNGRETALELRRERNKVSVHAYDPAGKTLTLMQGEGPTSKTTLMIERRGDTYACWVEGQLVWKGSLPFVLPPARPLLRALGDSRFAEGRERSVVFGPLRIKGWLREELIEGKVVDQCGEPIARAWVHIGGDPFSHAQTQADGRFALYGTPLEGDEIIAAAEGFEFASRPLPLEGAIVLAPSSPPRPEYPRPEFDRSHWWVNLNGTWQFALDPSDVGRQEGWQSRDEPYHAVIRVPYPWTSLMAVGEENLVADHRYAGIWAGYTGTAWYKRKVRIPGDAPEGRIGVLKFLAVNAQTDVYWDGEWLTSHDGGYDPFECEVGELVPGSEHTLVLRVHYPSAIDPNDVLIGKQGWWFTHAPGIWQTVWLEAREKTGHINRFHVRGDVRFERGARLVDQPREAAFHVQVAAKGAAGAVALRVWDPEGNVVCEKRFPMEHVADGDPGGSGGRLAGEVTIPIAQPALWDPDSPNLYRFEARLLVGEREIDRVKSYSGLRAIYCDWAPGHSPAETADPAEQYQYVYLNGRPLYLVGILDQAYNPWGIYTYRSYGPEDLAGSIQNDLQIAKSLGYNLIRLHIKTNEPLWLYEAARAGLLVWDELPNYRGTPESEGWSRLEKHLEAVHERDFNCPAIVIRSLFNESWGVEDMRVNPSTQEKIKELVARQRRLEPHRLVVDNSAAQGYPNRHIDTDINDEHIYVNDWWEWKRRIAFATAQVFPGSEYNFHSGTHEPDEAGNARQSGQPYVISEFTSHGRKTLALRMFPKIAGFVKIDLVDQEWERFTPYTYTRLRRPMPFLDAELRPLGEEMEHSLDAVIIDAPPINYLAPATRATVTIYVAAFHRTLAHAPLTLHVRCVAHGNGYPGTAEHLTMGEGAVPRADHGETRIVYEKSLPLTTKPFSVEPAGEFDVVLPRGGDRVYFFAWLTRGDTVTARDYAEWRASV